MNLKLTLKEIRSEIQVTRVDVSECTTSGTSKKKSFRDMFPGALL